MFFASRSSTSRVGAWRHPVLISAIGSLLVESVNFGLLIPPIDVGYPQNAPWWLKANEVQFGIIHALGIYTTASIKGHDALVIFIGGWLSTFVIALLVTLTLRLLHSRRPRSNRCPPPPTVNRG